MRTAGSRKGLLDTIGLKQLYERTRCVLLFSVAMKGQIFRSATLLVGIPECRSNKICAGVTRHSVSDNLAGKEIKDDAEINPVAADLEVCYAINNE